MSTCGGKSVAQVRYQKTHTIRHTDGGSHGPRRRLPYTGAMSVRTLLILASAVLVLGTGGVLLFGDRPTATDARLLRVDDPYAAPMLQPYGAFRTAMESGNAAVVQELADGDDGYLAYLAALAVARWPSIDATTRLAYLHRAMQLRVQDSLARTETRELMLEWGTLAELAGVPREAIEAYQAALPDARAIAALERLQPDPYKLSNTMLNARQYSRALAALDGRQAPSIEAPALRALGRQDEALAAYRAWLVEQPDSATAASGIAWTLYFTGDLEGAGAAFRSLSGANALYGRALIANRLGNIDTAVSLLEQTHDADWLWLSTSLLEARDRYQDAIPIYLRLARGGSAYADDAAYRAYVLASRLSDTATAAAAAALIPDYSFFALKLGRPLPVAALVQAQVATGDASNPARLASVAEASDLPVVQLAHALYAVHENEAAVGELVMALRDARAAPELGESSPSPYGSTVAERHDAVVTLAQALQSMGEFRQSVQAARGLLDTNDNDLRAWRLAYPAAYPEAVSASASAAGVKPELVWSIMRQESAFSPIAVSTSNAMGLMQVIPSTWDWLAELQQETPPADPFDPVANVRYGAYYLGWLMRYFDGDQELVITSYNRGQGYIRRLYESDYVAGNKDELYREIDALETREYLQRVSLNLATYQALYPAGDVVTQADSTEP